MRIGIDGAALAIPFPCGTKHYAESLLNGLAEIDNQNEYIIFSSAGVDIPRKRNFELVALPQWPVLKRQLFLPLLAYKAKIDLMHFLEPYSAVGLRLPKVVTTIHDLDLKLTYPWMSKYCPNRLWSEITRRMVVMHSTVLIAISRSIKRELSRGVGSTKKIIEIHQGIDHDVFKPSIVLAQNNYFLAMGDFTKRKNLLRVMRAHAIFAKVANKKCRLKIIVSASEFLPQLKREAERIGSHALVDFYVNVDQVKLVELYRKARAFIYASLYEGFGLPILEALACGTAVITSDRGATKEIGGEAVVLVDPESVESIVSAMTWVSDNLDQNKMRMKRGLSWANNFSWVNTARKTLAVYESLR